MKNISTAIQVVKPPENPNSPTEHKILTIKQPTKAEKFY